MNNFKPFYLFLLLLSSVIFIYLSFKSVVLLTILAVAVIWGSNVVNGSWKSTNTQNLTALKLKKPKPFSHEKKTKIKLSSKKNSYDRSYKQLFNVNSESDMPSTVKLTPGPNRQKTSVRRSQTFSSQSPYLRTSLLNSSCSFLEHSDGNFSISSSNGHSRSPAPFLPSIKRALGVSEYSPRQESPVVHQSYQNYPSQASPGFIPAVRLIKRERSHLGHQKSPSVRSSNIVRIGPPEPHKLSSPRLFHIQTSSSDSRRTPDTQAVILALKEKSLKRSYGGYDHDTSYTDYPVQQAKRRRQDSQQSNSSTSSLPPLPDSLPDLSSSGYTIPRLETPTLKRSALIDDWDDSCSAKKLRKDGRVNSILSSLSSSQRVAEKDNLVKRKVSTNGTENNQSISKQARKDKNEKVLLDRSDTVIISTKEGVEDTPTKETDTPVKDTSLNTSVTVDKPKLEKMVTLNQSFTARKRQMSLYSGLNKSFQKVPHANVIASMEDYENDMGAEKKRVQDMLEGIHQAETEKEKEKEAQENSKAFSTSVKASEIVPTITQVSAFQTTGLVTTATLSVSSAGLSLTSAGPISSSTSTSSVTTTLASNPMMFKFATVKSSSPLKTTTKVGLMSGSSPIGGISSSAGGNTTTVTSAGMALSTGFSVSAVSASGASTSVVPPFGLNTAQGTSAPSGISFGTNVTPASSTSSQSGFNFGSQPELSSVPGFGTTPSTTPSMTTTAPPPYSFTTNVTNAPLATPTASGFNFGSATSAPGAPGTGQSASVFGTQQGAPAFGAQTQTSQPFGTQPPPAYGSQLSTPSFGATQPQSTASFGMQPSSNATFGLATTTANTTGTNPTASTFNFKPFNQTPAQQPTTQPSMFGSQPSAGISSFGSAGSTATTTPGFGSTPSSFGQATSTAQSGGFNFGASTPSFGSQGISGFGQTSSSSAKQFGTAGFGAASTQPGFSVTTASTTFGQGTTNMFSKTTTTASSFGQGSSGFGTSSGTGFGTTGPFGQSSVPKSTSSASFGPSFGQGGTTSGPTFGQGSTSFGTTTKTTASGFGGTTGFSFGQASNTFGTASTQASSSGNFAFGTPAKTTQPAANAAYNFGSSSGVPSTPNNKGGGGFDFSASTTPSNTGGGGYNFSANASFGTPTGMATPVFGTPTGGGTPNMFSVGGTGSIPKPRVARGRRRGGRGR
ncbi:nuclear pore complex protein DDB_G0274915-like [Mytilus californianus]|uniref:nuclear pore complex protein DDB_G0274915-like n=1 Tax=Mytilus californianus TaxID=6549 RepID=UPI0022481300|nr:nuclear pore complex protein DDB_G0274915-like [Mytilus californianus]